jgi:hypothetical protein
MSNNLGRNEVSAGQNQKEVTINESDGIIDAKLTVSSSFDFTSGDVTLTDDEFQRNLVVVCANVSVARVLNTPALPGFIIVDNSAGSDTVTVTRGSGTVAVATGEKRLCYQDGTANHVDTLS